MKTASEANEIETEAYSIAHAFIANTEDGVECRCDHDSENCPGVELKEMIIGLIEKAEAAARKEAMEECANIVNEWCCSTSCDRHDNNPCCHIRTASGIHERLSKVAAAEKEPSCKEESEK